MSGACSGKSELVTTMPLTIRSFAYRVIPYLVGEWPDNCIGCQLVSQQCSQGYQLNRGDLNIVWAMASGVMLNR